MGRQADEILPLHSFFSLLVRALGNSQKWTKQPNTGKRKFYTASNFMKILHENLSLQPSWGSCKFRFSLPQINYFREALQAWSCLPKRWWWNSSPEVTRPPKMIHLAISLYLVCLTGDKSSAQGKGRGWVRLPFFFASKLFGWIILYFETSLLRSGSTCTATSLPRIHWDVIHAESFMGRNLTWCYLVKDKHWVLSEQGIPVSSQRSVNLIKFLKIDIH